MTVVGGKFSSEERNQRWSSMVLLRELIKADKCNKDRRIAYHKNSSLYNYFLEDYVST